MGYVFIVVTFALAWTTSIPTTDLPYWVRVRLASATRLIVYCKIDGAGRLWLAEFCTSPLPYYLQTNVILYSLQNGFVIQSNSLYQRATSNIAG